MKSNKKVPIERINKFFSQDDFDLEVDFGREWLEGDINIKVILYQVDRTETTNDDIYGEAAKEDIMFKPPVELSVSFNMAAPTNKAYNSDGSMRYLEYGTITLGIYQDQLDEMGVDIEYGDYIGYAENETNIKYFTVSNNGKIFSDNSHTIGGYKGFYRTITCVPTDLDEFNGM
jgi:hypothetical protein|tara:strand:- start:7024 stop:7545 length:522 start_codon:yes stop_codon:yes gene_type:complete